MSDVIYLHCDTDSPSTSSRLTTAVIACVVFALAACASFGTRLARSEDTVESISVGGSQGADAMVTLSLRVEIPYAI